MSGGKVVSIKGGGAALGPPDGNGGSLEAFLEDTLKRLRAGELNATSAVVLLLNEGDAQNESLYQVWQGTYGLKTSEAVSLLECAKSLNVKDLGF